MHSLALRNWKLKNSIISESQWEIIWFTVKTNKKSINTGKTKHYFQFTSDQVVQSTSTYRTVQSLLDHDWFPLNAEPDAPCVKLQSLGWNISLESDEGEAT